MYNYTNLFIWSKSQNVWRTDKFCRLVQGRINSPWACKVASEKKTTKNEKQNWPQTIQNQETVWYLLETRGGFLFNLDQCVKAQVFATSFEVLPSTRLQRHSFLSGWSSSVRWAGRRGLLAWWFSRCRTGWVLQTRPPLTFHVGGYPNWWDFYLQHLSYEFQIDGINPPDLMHVFHLFCKDINSKVRCFQNGCEIYPPRGQFRSRHAVALCLSDTWGHLIQPPAAAPKGSSSSRGREP